MLTKRVEAVAAIQAATSVEPGRVMVMPRGFEVGEIEHVVAGGRSGFIVRPGDVVKASGQMRLTILAAKKAPIT